eukprot:gb/GECG01006714.1/.p1 GENE.gb/GECG01006714.1/~~gb/GECG01006714.1/.p1  ORF type:complete len:117 (+),score=17.19 gb/GECG01006714.1/:1-351(+)
MQAHNNYFEDIGWGNLAHDNIQARLVALIREICHAKQECNVGREGGEVRKQIKELGDRMDRFQDDLDRMREDIRHIKVVGGGDPWDMITQKKTPTFSVPSCQTILFREVRPQDEEL